MWRVLFLCVLCSQPIWALTIEEKRAQSVVGNSDLSPVLYESLLVINARKEEISQEIRECYAQGGCLYEAGEMAALEALREKVLGLKQELVTLDEQFRRQALAEDQELYALWHQPDTTLEQLVIDYGSQDYVYLIPPEVGAIPLSISSSLPIPRSAWSTMLEQILEQNGVYVEELSPYLRKLSLIDQDVVPIRRLVNSRQELVLLPPEMRVCFVWTPDLIDMKRTRKFLDKFSHPQTQHVEQLGKHLLITSTVRDLEELFKALEFMEGASNSMDYQLVSVSSVPATEMARMLRVFFEEELEDEDEMFGTLEGLKVMTFQNLPYALFIAGSTDMLARAQEFIASIDRKAFGAKEREFFWYTCKHADPEELATVLDRVYGLLRCDYDCDPQEFSLPQEASSHDKETDCGVCPPWGLYDASCRSGDLSKCPLPVNLAPPEEKKTDASRQNFVVDLKTGAILMVVEKEFLPKIQEAIKRLDVPRRMVQIEVLLFERKTSDRNLFKLNGLTMGSCASNTRDGCFVWGGGKGENGRSRGLGILDYFLSFPKSGVFPAIDVDYQFILKQEDIQVNAAPSVITLNQTQATIAIVDEISVNMGAVAGARDTQPELSFERKQYGITLTITPTIHISQERDWLEGSGVDLITLDTKVNFDHIEPGTNQDQPRVARRNIENQAIVSDGQSVVLGGLRRKNHTQTVEKIPFLGDIPCIGKLFANTDSTEISSEMFIMITPKIIKDPLCELEWIKQEEMKRRPGDLPEYLYVLQQSLQQEKQRAFASTMEWMCGPSKPRVFSPGWHRDACDF